MKGIILGLGLSALFINTSCKKCKQCHYEYSKTEIIQTANGEDTKITEGLVGYVIDDNNLPLKEECIKSGEGFTIEVKYQQEADDTSLDDFEVICVDV